MNPLLNFLKSQKLLVIACRDGEDVWTANVYYGIDDDFKIYFISSGDAKHSRMILKNPEIAFSVAWFDPKDHKNRKAVQGLGICRPAETDEEIVKGVELHNRNFPEFAGKITVDWARKNKPRVWVVEPSYIKYWDDERYGEDGTEEFKF